jgi:hypothetical protein
MLHCITYTDAMQKPICCIAKTAFPVGGCNANPKMTIGYEINWNKVVFGGTLYSGSEW